MPRALPEPREHRGCPDLPLRGFPPRSADTAGDAIQRPRRLHGAGAGQTRRQPPDAPAIHPRRRRDVRGPRPGPDAALSRPPRVRVVRARRHARAQPGPVRRRHGRRGRRRKYEDDWVKQRARAPRATSEAGCRKSRRPGTERARGPPSRRRDADGDAAVRLRSLLHGLQVRSRATTISPAASSSKARTCCGSSTTRLACSTTSRTTTRTTKTTSRTRRKTAKKKAQKEPSARERKQEEDINRKMNKTALVTLWVDPAEYQIVKYTFDNVWMDFLPGAWLVRVDDIRASMTMGQPFPGRVAAARDERARRRLARDGSVRSGLRAQVHELQAGGGEVASFAYRRRRVRSVRPDALQRVDVHCSGTATSAGCAVPRRGGARSGRPAKTIRRQKSFTRSGFTATRRLRDEDVVKLAGLDARAGRCRPERSRPSSSG